MTVSSTVSKSGPYIGNGATTTFPYSFRVLDASHLAVIRTVDGVDATAPSSSYTVTGVGSSGGNVVMNAAPIAGVLITILLSVPLTQQIDLENQGPYFAQTVEGGFDLAVMRDQQLQEQLDRTPKLPASTVALDLPALTAGIIALADVAEEIAQLGPVASQIAEIAVITDEIAIAPAMAALAEEWAQKPYAQTVTGTIDGRSALHWSIMANQAATEAASYAAIFGSIIYDFGSIAEATAGEDDWGTL